VLTGDVLKPALLFMNHASLLLDQQELPANVAMLAGLIKGARENHICYQCYEFIMQKPNRVRGCRKPLNEIYLFNRYTMKEIFSYKKL
jgi:hypothetical protein